MTNRLFFYIIFCLQTLISQSKLIFVLETFRHGARDPITDFWNAKEFKTKGELTPVGMRQHFALGQVLRKEYIDELGFLSPNYTESEIYVYSTNVNRTIISALSQLYGLYPIGTGPTIPQGFNFSLLMPPFNDSYLIKEGELEALPNGYQPIPIHTGDYSQEYLLRSWDPRVCPIVSDWYNEQYETNEFKQLVKDFNETLMGVAEMVNLPKETMDYWKLHGAYGVFINDIYSGKDLPKNFGIYEKNLTFLYNYLVYLVDFGSVKQRRYLSTPIFSEILDLFSKKIDGTNRKKWVILSGHDNSIMNILAGLNFTSHECILEGWKKGGVYDHLCFDYPGYAANMIFELHNNTNKFSVKIRYNGEYIKEYSYNEFVEKLKGSLVKDFQEVCLNQSIISSVDITKKSSNSASSWRWFFLGLLVGLVLTLIGVFILYKKNEVRNQGKMPFAVEMAENV